MLRQNNNHIRRTGFALVDVIAGGIMLGIGLAVIMSIVSRSLMAHTDGEKRLTAAWLADGLLNMVLAEGPDVYPKIHDTAGEFGEPFPEFSYAVVFEDLGETEPWAVTAIVRWNDGAKEIKVETLIATRINESVEPRAPEEPIDRDARYYDEP